MKKCNIKILSLIGIVFASLCFIGCNKENEYGIKYGDWKNDRNDIFRFEKDNHLLYIHTDPDYIDRAKFYIKNDSIILNIETSSDTHDFRIGYPIKLGESEFTIYNFNEREQDTYKWFK